MVAMTSNVHVLQHPLARVLLTSLRDKATRPDHFRVALQRLAALLFVEASRDVQVATIQVTTPLTVTDGAALARPIVLVPVLRAGLGLIDGILDLVPDAVVAHIGIARDEETALPQPYYAKLPGLLSNADVFLLDPMLATGGSAIEAANQLKQAGVQGLRFACVVSCPVGIAAFQAAHPDVPVFTAAIDERLNERNYIVPGLGDAGDRYFGT
jgi:uracil phosphoribosyltransferase